MISESKCLLTIIVLVFISSIPLKAQPPISGIEIISDPVMLVNWEQTRSAELHSSCALAKCAVKWYCSNNPEVKFSNPSGLNTTVTFPRTGYFLIRVEASVKGKNIVSDEVILNVCKPNSYQERLEDLINLMTPEEKIDQLGNEAPAITRLGLPAYNYWSEALHGVLDIDATSFPQAIAMGSTWDPELLHRVASAISDEARVKNAVKGKGLTYWSPTVNIARDPRWGRNEECYSEDPFLLSRMGVAFVKGLQGDHPYYLKTVATPKHFIANNEEERRHTGSSDVDMRSLWEYYMPAFKSAIMEGEAYSIMGAYNRVNHVPACANSFLLTDVLRNQWGFKGYVVSDCGAINDMVNGHHFYSTGAEAVAGALTAGCDLNCGTYYQSYLAEALELGYIDEQDLNRALRRILSARFKLGEFDPPEWVPYSSIPASKLESKEHRQLALEASRKAIVLLKNEGVLPIDTKKINSIAVIGPNASECQLGIYSGWPGETVNPLEGIKREAEKHGIRIDYAQGCEIGGGLMKIIEPQYFSMVDGTGLNGMYGEYFDNNNLEGKPVFTRVDSVIDFNFGGGSPAPGIPEDKFSIRWTGKIVPAETRTYLLGTRTDDGARLYLDGKLIIDDWTDHGEKPNSAKVDLIAGKEYSIVFEYYDNGMGAAALLTWDLEEQNFQHALKLAGTNDLVILMMGITPGLASEEHDRLDISLPKIQQELIKEVAKVNPNIVTVLINGGPVALNGAEDLSSAIVEAWYGGQYQGTAIADVLFGNVNPGGKLSQTFYQSAEQLPSFSDYDLINHERSYMYFKGPVLFPFGHGLSYTSFEYRDLITDREKVGKEDTITVLCSVKNTGKYPGDEVVQIYCSDREATVKVPVRKLQAFQRITLIPGEIKTLSFNIPVSELGFYDTRTNRFKVESGEFEIQAGSSSADIRLRKSFWVE